MAIEYIRWLQHERDKINHPKLENIQFFEKGLLLNIPRETIAEFSYTGLNNMDFVLTNAYKDIRKGEQK